MGKLKNAEKVGLRDLDTKKRAKMALIESNQKFQW
jgi:hypothetical protein